MQRCVAKGWTVALSRVPRHLMWRIDMYRGPPRFMGRAIWTVTLPHRAKCVAVTNEGVVLALSRAVYGYFNMLMFSTDGTPLGLWGAIRQGTRPEELHDPVHMAVAPTDEVILADIKQNKVLVFRAPGIFLHALAFPIHAPFHIAVSTPREVAVVSQEHVHVCRLADGMLLKTLVACSALSTWFPLGVAFLPDGKVSSITRPCVCAHWDWPGVAG